MNSMALQMCTIQVFTSTPKGSLTSKVFFSGTAIFRVRFISKRGFLGESGEWVQKVQKDQQKELLGAPLRDTYVQSPAKAFSTSQLRSRLTTENTPDCTSSSKGGHLTRRNMTDLADP